MEISSLAFKEGGTIPPMYTCDDVNISPPLIWKNFPDGTQSFALICDDPDAPGGTWVHWVIYNIPNYTGGLGEDVKPDKVLPDGSVHGITDFKKLGYGGPCPPGGTHRYFFKLYALDTMLDEEPGLTKSELLKKMEGHILDEAVVMGKYKRS